MATVKGGIFEKGAILDNTELIPSGRISPFLYFRWVNEKLQLCSMPSHYNKSMEPDQVNRRDKMRVNGKFCKHVNSNPLLHQAWGKIDLDPDKIYNRISQVNFDLCRGSRMSDLNVITPPGGFPLKIESLVMDQGKVLTEIMPVNIEGDESKVIYLLYLALYGPTDPDAFYFKFFPVKEGEAGNQNITFNLDSQEQKLADSYNFKIFYLCAVTLDKNGDVMRSSQTISADSGAALEIPEEILLNTDKQECMSAY